MLRNLCVVSLLVTFPSCAQVLDVNNDRTVGPEEALALAMQWKATTATPNAHTHLGQTWLGNNNPLTIRGNFPGGSILPFKDKQTLPIPTRLAAPLVLDNTGTWDGGTAPDLIVAGGVGNISAISLDSSELALEANRHVVVTIDVDNYTPPGLFDGLFIIRTGAGHDVFTVTTTGDLYLDGTVHKSSTRTVINHPLDPDRKVLVHASVDSPEMKNVYDGVAVLDDRGEGVVELPNYFESLNSDYRYQLTALGSPGPNLYVAEEVEGNQFRIAGGISGQKVSWMVTGIRRDTYAKAHPVVVEESKSDEKYIAVPPGMGLSTPSKE